MTKISKRAETLLEELHLADLAYRNAEIMEERRAQREKAERILAVKVNRDKIAAQLRIEEEVSWERIAGAMGVKGTARGKKAVADGRHLLVAEDRAVEDEPLERFSWDADAQTLTVSLTAADVAPILEFTPYSMEDVAAEPGLLTATFARNGDQWEAEKPAHPVTALFFSPVHTSLLASAEAFVEGSGVL